MPIVFLCPYCSKKFQVKDEMAGRTVKCTACQQAFKIPPAPNSTLEQTNPSVQSPTSSAPQTQIDPLMNDLLSQNQPSTYGGMDWNDALPGSDFLSNDPMIGDPLAGDPLSEGVLPMKKRKKIHANANAWIMPALLTATGLAVAVAAAFVIIGAVKKFQNGSTPLPDDIPVADEKLAWPTEEEVPLAVSNEIIEDNRTNVRGVTLERPGDPKYGNTRLAVYLPPGNLRPGSVPCLFCPRPIEFPHGGSKESHRYLFTDASREKNIVIVVYYVDDYFWNDFGGTREGYPEYTDEDLRCLAFLRQRGGLVQARDAVEYAIKNIVAVDPTKLYAAGLPDRDFSNYGTDTAVLHAMFDERIRACLAVNSRCDLLKVSKHFDTGDQLDRTLRNRLESISFSSYPEKVRCPTYLVYLAPWEDGRDQSASEFREAVKGSGQGELVQIVNGADAFASQMNEFLDGLYD